MKNFLKYWGILVVGTGALFVSFLAIVKFILWAVKHFGGAGLFISLFLVVTGLMALGVTLTFKD